MTSCCIRASAGSARSALDFAGEHVDAREITLVADPDVVEPLGILLVGQEGPRAVLRWPLERHAVFTFARPLALQIRDRPTACAALHVDSRFGCASAARGGQPK